MLPIEVYRHICNVLDVDIDQAFRVAYGQEVIYLPYGVSEDEIMYQLDNIASEELRGGSTYGVLKLLIVVLFIVASFAVSRECEYIFPGLDISRTSYNFLTYEEIPRLNDLNPKERGINAAKLKDFLLCLEHKEPFGKYRSVSAQAAQAQGSIMQIVVGIVGVVSIIYFIVSFCKQSFGKGAETKVQQIVRQVVVKTTSSKTPSSAIVPFKPGKSSSRKRSSSPAKTPRSRRLGGGELELIVRQLNEAFATIQLSAGSSCNMLETTATMVVIVLVVLCIIIFAWENVLTLSSVKTMVRKVRFFLAELNDVMFTKWEHSWGFVGDVLRKVGTVIDTVSEYVFNHILALSRAEFANVSLELLGIGKAPEWAKGIFTGFATKNIQTIGYNIIETVLKAIYRIITTTGSAIWSTSQQYCLDFKEIRGSSVKIPIAATIKEIKQVITMSPATGNKIEKIGEEVKSAVKRVKKVTNPIKTSPKRKRLSPKT